MIGLVRANKPYSLSSLCVSLSLSLSLLVDARLPTTPCALCWTGLNIQYGTRISDLLRSRHGYKHDTPFVINTAMNGRGDVRYRHGKHGKWTTYWCNPPKRAVGIPTTAHTAPYVNSLPHSYRGGKNLVDAYALYSSCAAFRAERLLMAPCGGSFVWFMNPGQSYGDTLKQCIWRPYTKATTPPAGYWFRSYANDLVNNIPSNGNWLLPPKGYVNGWPKGAYPWPTKCAVLHLRPNFRRVAISSLPRPDCASGYGYVQLHVVEEGVTTLVGASFSERTPGVCT